MRGRSLHRRNQSGLGHHRYEIEEAKHEESVYLQPSFSQRRMQGNNRSSFAFLRRSKGILE